MNTKAFNEIQKDKRSFLLNNLVKIESFYYDLSSLLISFTLNGVKLDVELTDRQVESLLPYDANVVYSDGFNIQYDSSLLTYAEYFESVPSLVILDFLAVHFALGRQSLIVTPNFNQKQTA